MGNSDRQLADGLTKNSGDPNDLLRACMKNAIYQLSDEALVLQLKSAEREYRRRLGAQRLQDAKQNHSQSVTSGEALDSGVFPRE